MLDRLPPWQLSTSILPDRLIEICHTVTASVPTYKPVIFSQYMEKVSMNVLKLRCTRARTCMKQFYCERDSIAYQHGSSSCPLSSYNASAIPFTFSLLPIPSDTVKADRDAWCTNGSAQNLCHYKVILMVHLTVHHRTSETVMVQAPSLGANWPLDSKPIKSLDPPMNS